MTGPIPILDEGLGNDNQRTDLVERSEDWADATGRQLEVTT